MSREPGRAERRFDIPFVAPLALAEKQIQQSYRPYIQVHKWFARRPGTLFRALLLAEFGDERPLRDAFYEGHDLGTATVLDPFMGGGTPALEANRLGLNVVACDINPMAAWIVRQELADLDVEALRVTAEKLLRGLEKEFGAYYLTRCIDCGEDAPVKYFLWVKTLDCPECDARVDLFPGYLIASNARHPRHVLLCPACRDLFEVEEMPATGARVRCTKCRCEWDNVPVARGNRYSCGACGHDGRYPRDLRVLGPPAHTLLALEYHCPTCAPGRRGRFFKAADAQDHERHAEAARALRRRPRLRQWIPDDEIPAGDETTRLHRWGYERFAELFGPRQLLALAALARRIHGVKDPVQRHALATVFSDFLRYQNMLGRYDTYALKCQDIFSVHGYPVGLVQCENNVFGIPRVGSGAFRHFLEKYVVAKAYNRRPFEVLRRGGRKIRVPTEGEHIGAEFVEGMPGPRLGRQAWVVRGDASNLRLPAGSVDAVLTDPPYFDNVQYAELMDFCYVWLRRLVGKETPYFSEATTRRAGELTGNRTAGRDLEHFCDGLSAVYRAAAHALKPGGPFAFTYHHNDVEAYLPVAVALLDADLRATASLACPAEMTASLHIAQTGSSVVDTILCARKRVGRERRPRPNPGEIGRHLRAQVSQLREGGLTASPGDRRCMALGLLTVEVVNALAPRWSASRPARERLARVAARMDQMLAEVGGLDALISSSLVAPRGSGQLELFTERVAQHASNC